MAKTIRLTVAQALVKFLNNQYIEFDGKENKMFEGIFGIFGHGNVVGMGQALEEDAGDLIMRMGRNEQGMAHAAMGFAKQKRRKQMYACTSSVGPRRDCNRELHSCSFPARRYLRRSSTRSRSSANGTADEFSNYR